LEADVVIAVDISNKARGKTPWPSAWPVWTIVRACKNWWEWRGSMGHAPLLER